MNKKVFSGIQPSGAIHIGNYLGAIKNWVSDQNKKDNIFCIVDLHAITVPQDPQTLKDAILELAKVLLACGIDPKKSILFVQSDRPEHSELAWILNCYTGFGELSRMTQYKEKAKSEEVANEIAEIIVNTRWDTLKNKRESYDRLKRVESELLDKSSVGLFNYPVLMAADILLYDTDLVPVGEDQKQHVELARDLAQRMNNKFGDVFVVPQPDIKKEGARIMGLDDPTKKMAKSASSENNYIALRDSAEVIRKKIQKAVTDTGSEIAFDKQKKPAIANLLSIYSLFSGKDVDQIVAEYKGKGYANFKHGLADVIISGLTPIQKKLAELDANPKYVREVLDKGAKKAAPTAAASLSRVKKIIGLG